MGNYTYSYYVDDMRVIFLVTNYVVTLFSISNL